MSLSAHLRLFFGAKRSSTVSRPKDRHRFKPVLELLEDRLAPATFTVMNYLDAGTGSLRQAILDANATAAADTISFAAALMNHTIRLTTGALTITKPVAIVGLGSTNLVIDANNLSRVFNINDLGVTKIVVSISGLKLTHGKADDGAAGTATDGDRGGAIFNREALTLAGCLLDDNAAAADGGGIANLGGKLTVTNSTLSTSRAANFGGGIYNDSGSVTLTNLTLSGNSALTRSGNSVTSGNGGAIFNTLGSVTLTNSTLSANSASNFGGGICSIDGNVAVANSTLSANPASFGGGIYNSRGNVTVANSTTYNFAGTATKILARHTVKVGGEYRRNM